MKNSPFLDKWPNVCFDELENIEVEPMLAGFYKSFFSVMKLPEYTVRAFAYLIEQDQRV